MAPAPSGRTYSYQGQDLFVVAMLGGMRNGFFLDSGASDGLSGSNTRLLEEEYGWTGICVEPNDDLFRQLVANRRCICLNCCLYDHEGTVDFLEAGQVFGGILNEYDPTHLQYTRQEIARRWPAHRGAAPVTKPARTARSVLCEAGAPPVIDYWSLDTEGSELAILSSFPFDEYRVRVLTVEHNFASSREEIRRLLERQGYRRVSVLGIDDAYALGSEVTTPPWRSHSWRSRAAPA